MPSLQTDLDGRRIVGAAVLYVPVVDHRSETADDIGALPIADESSPERVIARRRSLC